MPQSKIEANRVSRELFGEIIGHKATEKKVIRNSLKTYLMLSEFVKREKLDALSFRCWPELKSHGIGAPCLALSLLNNEGCPATCEGDLTAAVSMLILKELSGKPVYLGDFLSFDEEDSKVARFFHCGAAASFLTESKSNINYCVHSEGLTWDPGITVEFPVRAGSVTFARLGEIGGKYRISTFEGEALRTEMFCRGNPARVKLKKDAPLILEKSIKSGAEHHQIMVHGDLSYELTLLSKWLRIELIEI